MRIGDRWAGDTSRWLALASLAVNLVTCAPSDALETETVSQAIWNGATDTTAAGRGVASVLTQRFASPPLPAGAFFCSGTFLTQTVLLTAAHCIRSVNRAGVQLGPTDLSNSWVTIGVSEVSGFRRRIQSFVARQTPAVVNTSNDDHDIALLILETPESALSGFPQGTDGIPGTPDDPLGPDNTPNTPDDLDAFVARPQTLYTGPTLVGPSVFSSALFVGYGLTSQTGAPIPKGNGGGVGTRIRSVSTMNPVPFVQPPNGPDWNGDGATDAIFETIAYRVLPIVDPNGTVGDADDLYLGTDSGDSGGPLLASDPSGNTVIHGVGSTSCVPDSIADPDGMAGTGDEYMACIPPGLSCPSGQLYYRSPLVPLAATGCAVPGPGVPANATQGTWASTYANVASPTTYANACNTDADCVTSSEATCLDGVCTTEGNQDWLLRNLQDPARPNRWLGERDYTGPCRPGVDGGNLLDQACDRFLDGLGADPSNHCPAIFDADGGFFPELRSLVNTPVFGADGVNLHDRVELRNLNQNPPPQGTLFGTPADAVAGSGIFHIGNDVILRSGYGGNDLRVDWRAEFFSLNPHPGSAITFLDPSYPPPNTVVLALPKIRLTATFPTDANGTPLYSNGNAVTLQNSSTLALNDGDFVRSVDVHNGSTLRLNGAGHYYFEDMKFQAGGRLEIDHTGGAVEIYVRNTFDWQGGVLNAGGRRAAHVIGVFGSLPVRFQQNATFIGTVVAPNATIDMGTTNTIAGQGYFGGFYGKKVIIHQGSTVVSEPCELVY
jgi:hypothetical protein